MKRTKLTDQIIRKACGINTTEMILKWIFFCSFLVHVLANNIEAEVDVIIVGAGVAGLSAAEELIRYNRHCTILESDAKPSETRKSIVRCKNPFSRLDSKLTAYAESYYD